MMEFYLGEASADSSIEPAAMGASVHTLLKWCFNPAHELIETDKPPSFHDHSEGLRIRQTIVTFRV